MIESLFDYVFIEIEGSLFNTDSGIKGHDGTNIVIDPSYDPQVHIKISGKVVSIPEKLSRRPISQETNGLPSATFSSNFKYKRREDIVPEVIVGDTIYFHFNTLASEEGKKNRIEGNIYKVAYENILCVVREEHFRVVKSKEGIPIDSETTKRIIMIGGYCLIKPDIETWEETMVPVPVMLNGQPMKDKFGKVIMKDKKDWIIAKLEPENRYLQGYCVNIGTPLKGESKSINVGDKVWYRKDADWRQRIEGKDYFVIRQRHILAKLDKALL